MRTIRQYNLRGYRVKRMGIQRHTAVPDNFSAGDSQGKFMVEEDRKSEMKIV
jgi:hypothetical protein